MLGAMLFFLGSITYLLSAIIWYSVPFEYPLSDGSYVMEIAAAIMFILNSAALFANHAVFRWLKKVSK
jgi:tellurite resistance protein TehA-like permease